MAKAKLELNVGVLRVLAVGLGLGALVMAEGCAAYAVPGRGANFNAMGLTPSQRDMASDRSIVDAMAKKPLAGFPASIAVVRVESARYKTDTNVGWGNGAYSVVFVRDVEKAEQFEHFAKRPMVAGLAPLNPLLMSEHLDSERNLRLAAAELHADILLVYTLDTTFNNQDMAELLSVVTLGLSPSKHISVTTTASAVLVDTRNGYIYGTAEATETRTGITNAWFSEAAADGARLKNETAAFAKLAVELERTWDGVVKQYATAPPATAAVVN